MKNEFRFTFTEEWKVNLISRIKDTIVFEYFSLPEKKEEKEILLDEINVILDKGITPQELLEIQTFYVYSDEEHDLNKMARLCLQLVFKEVLEDYRRQVCSLKNDNNYNQAFETAVEEIIKYIKDERTDFPESTLKCLYLLTDEDIDGHNQTITSQQIMLRCLPFCDTLEKSCDLEEKVFAAML